MQEVSFDDLDFSTPDTEQVEFPLPAQVEETQPVEVSFDELDFSQPEESIVKTEDTLKAQGWTPQENAPKALTAVDVYKNTLAETGSKEEAQTAMANWKVEQNSLQGVGFAGGDKGVEDLMLGVRSTMAGVGQMGIDIGQAIGLDFDQLDEKNQKLIKYLNFKVNDKDFFSMNTMGRLIPTLATMPVAYASKLLAFTVEGAIGYAEARGEGADKLGSAISGLVAGGGTAAVMKAFEMLGNKGSKVLDEIRKEFASTIDGNEDKIFAKYAKFTGKSTEALTNYDKTMAILSHGEDKGAAYFKVAAENDAKAKKALDSLSESKKNVINTSGPDKNSKGMVARAIKPAQEQIAFASEKYTEFKDLIFKSQYKQEIPLTESKTLILDNLDNIPDLQKSAVVKQVIKKLSSDEPVTLEDLFDVREAMNAVTVKLKKVDKKGSQTIDGKEFIDTIITSHMPEEFSPLWSTLKDELSLAYSMGGKNTVAARNNTFGKLLTEASKGTRTFESIIKDIAGASDGPKGMKDVMKSIGSDKMAEFEQGLIKEVYSGNMENLGKTITRLEDIAFVTPEGKTLKRQMRQLDDAFNADDYYKIVADVLDGNRSIDGTSITANLLSKFKYSTMSHVWDYLKVLSPTQQGQFLRHMRRVTTAIKNAEPTVKSLDGVTPEMYRDFTKIVRSSIEKSINDEIGGLEKKLDTNLIDEGLQAEPKRIGVDLTHDTPNYGSQQNIDLGDNTIKHVSPEGQVVDDLLEYDSKKLVSNFIDESMVTSQLKQRIGMPINSSFEEVTDKIAGRIDTFVSTQRLQGIIKSYDKEIKGAIASQDRAKAFKTAKAIVEQEALNLIRNIEKDIGVKLPGAEADKIVLKKLKELMNGCK